METISPACLLHFYVDLITRFRFYVDPNIGFRFYVDPITGFRFFTFSPYIFALILRWNSAFYVVCYCVDSYNLEYRIIYI